MYRFSRRRVATAVCICCAITAFAAGQEESGRDIAFDLVDDGALVADALLDAESVIDDYDFPYENREGEAISVFVESDKPLSYVWGDTITVQVGVRTNTETYFPERPFNYVVFFNDPGLLDDEKNREAIADRLGRLVREHPLQNIYVYLHGDKSVQRVTSNRSALMLLEEAAKKEWSGSPDRTLESMMQTAYERLDGDSVRFLWVLGRPVSNAAYGFDRVEAVINALRYPRTEISYVGFVDALRPRSVNKLVRSFGGNSHYMEDPSELPDILQDDFVYYNRPAISNLTVQVHSLGGNPQPVPIREFQQRSMGVDEHQTILARIQVPPITTGESTSFRGDQFVRVNVPGQQEIVDILPTNQPIALVTYEYEDRRDGSLQRGSNVVTVSYTIDYDEYIGAWNYQVIKNTVVVETFTVLSEVSNLIRYRAFGDAIARLEAQISILTRLMHFVQDPLIADDVKLLSDYERRILELKRDPSRSELITEQLGRIRY